MLEILLQINTHTAAGRPLIRGIGGYARRRGPWRFDLDQVPTLELFRSRDLSVYDGVIFGGRIPGLAEAVAGSGLPAVAVATPEPVPGFPTVVSDHTAVGRLAAEHLLDRGLRRFGYVDLRPDPYSHPRGRAFAEALEGHDCRCEFFEPGADARQVQQHLSQWVGALGAESGILAAEDRTAFTVIRAALRAGFKVPEHIAVLGINNEELFAELSWPTITSIDHGAERIGHDAAGLLDRMIRKEKVPKVVTVPPVRVVERHSTDVLAVDDPDVAAALQLIRREATAGLTVEKVLDEVLVSRTTLENRFKAALGRTIFAEITRVRIERVKTLLRTTDLGLADIAARTGFNYLSHLSKAFRQATGESPTQFRKR